MLPFHLPPPLVIAANSCATTPSHCCSPPQSPPEFAKPIFLQYALLEEQHGLAKHAMEVYSRAARTVPKVREKPADARGW